MINNEYKPKFSGFEVHTLHVAGPGSVLNNLYLLSISKYSPVCADYGWAGLCIIPKITGPEQQFTLWL